MANKSIGLLTIAFGADLRGFEKAMKKAQRSIKKFGSSMKRTGQNLTRNVTLPIIGLGAIAIKTFADFEQSMLKVQAISGATGKEFESLENNAKLLGRTTMFTASQVAGLQIELAKLGFATNDINNSTKAILQLSQATGHDLAESGKIVAATLNSFNLETTEAAKVADIFAVASSNAAIDMEKLSVAMPTVGATASAVGVPLEHLTAMMMTLADRGMEASTMGTHLRKIFVELATKGISLDEAMLQINNSTNKVKTATELFGKRAFAAGIILSDNTDTTKKYGEAIDNAAGKSKKMADIMDSGLSGAMRRLKSQAEGIAIELGEILLPIIIEMGNKIKDFAIGFANLDDDTKKVIVTIGILAGAIGPLLLLVGSLTIAFAALFSPGGAVLVGILAVGAGFVFISENFEAMKERLSDWSWWKNSLINAAQQMILIFGGPIARKLGITQAVLKLEKDTKQYENEFGTFADAIKAKAEDLTDVFLKLGKSFGLGSSGGISGSGDDSGIPFMSAIKPQKFIGPMNQIGETIKKLTQEQLEFNSAMTMFEGIMTSAMTSAAHSTDEFFKGFIEAIKQSIKQLLIQLAVAIVIKSLFGFDTEKYSSAFQAAKGGVLGLAKGGLVTGPTMALVGEGAGTTASNPEVVAPLDKLKGMINNNGGGGGKIEVFGRISGNDIFLSNQKSTNSRFRSV